MLYYLRLIISFTLIITSFLILIFPISIIVIPFKAKRRVQTTCHFWKVFSRLTLFILNIKINLKDMRHKDLQTKNLPPGLYISNHQSMMDIPILLSLFQMPPIMKKSILYIPIFGICAYSSGALVVDRKNPDSRKKVLRLSMEELIVRTKSLQYYPEGTRNKEESGPKEFEKIKTPLLKFAYKNDIQVHAISIFGSNKIKKIDMPFKFDQEVGIRITKAIYPRDFEKEEDFLFHCWQEVQLGYRELSES